MKNIITLTAVLICGLILAPWSIANAAEKQLKTKAISSGVIKAKTKDEALKKAKLKIGLTPDLNVKMITKPLNQRPTGPPNTDPTVPGKDRSAFDTCIQCCQNSDGSQTCCTWEVEDGASCGGPCMSCD
jgi:hypothetical protein